MTKQNIEIQGIIMQNGKCYLMAMSICEVIEYESYFNITFCYNPEGDNDWDFDKGNMTYSEIKAFKKWLLKDQSVKVKKGIK